MQLSLPFIILLGETVPVVMLNMLLPTDEKHIVEIEFEANKVVSFR